MHRYCGYYIDHNSNQAVKTSGNVLDAMSVKMLGVLRSDKSMLILSIDQTDVLAKGVSVLRRDQRL